MNGIEATYDDGFCKRKAMIDAYSDQAGWLGGTKTVRLSISVNAFLAACAGESFEFYLTRKQAEQLRDRIDFLLG